MYLRILVMAMIIGLLQETSSWELNENPIIKRKLLELLESDRSFKFCTYVDIRTFYPHIVDKDFFDENFCPHISLATNRAMEDFPKNVSISPSRVLIFSNDQKDTFEKISFLSNIGLYNPTLPTIFFFKVPVENLVYIDGFLEKILMFGIFNSLIVFYHNKVEGFSYDPGSRKFYGIDAFRNSFINEAEIANFHRYKLRLAMFQNPPRIFKDITGEWHSDDEFFWSKLISDMNGTIELVETPPYDLDAAKIAVMNGLAHFCPLSYFRTSIPENLDFSAPHCIEYLVALVPNSDVFPQYMFMLKTFKHRVWIFIFFTVLSMTVFLIALERIQEPHRVARTSVVLDIIRILTGRSIRIYSDNSWLKKSFLCFCHMNCIVIIAGFHSALISTMLAVRYKHQINTLDHLVESQLTVYALPDIKIYVEEFSPMFKKQLVKIPRRQYQSLLTNQVYGQALVMPYSLSKQALQTINFEGSDVRYRIMPESMMSGFSTYFFTKSSPFLKKFDNMILKKYQYGIDRRPTPVMKERPTSPENHKPLSLAHLGIIFAFWGVGVVSSIILFLFERFHNVS